ncbi:SepM family pheromone-processing serine protease [Fictibacillus iocasae]|uniref:endopeptidase La n=1 Tax=Fictibacillus iocasae TaxID=2715437 RepID=A0ABW2NQG2_9BACL
MTENESKKSRAPFFSSARKLILVLLGAAVIALYPLPYYITSPGDAKVLDPIIKVEGGDDDKGVFMLTTVRIGKANIPQYIWAKASDFKEIIPAEEVRQKDESDEEYNQRQLQMMEDSQHAATVVAFKKSGEKVDISYHGVYVTGIIEGMPAEGVLKPGDIIVKMDSQKVNETMQLLDYVASKKEGDKVKVVYKRGGKQQSVTLPLAPFPKELESSGKSKAGLGITYPVTDISIKTDPPLNINASEIGGPSAGLMFTLEIMNQLQDKDLAKGRKIAGTGTMNLNEEVGPIGGISQKIVAADESGAEIFFAPVAANNYKDAVKAGKSIDTKMKIVPVKKLDDALKYLEGLKEKK